MMQLTTLIASCLRAFLYGISFIVGVIFAAYTMLSALGVFE